MKSGSNSIYKETMSLGAQVPVPGVTGRFAMLPAEILSRTDLKPSAKIVFATMRMVSFNSGHVTISHAALGTLAGLSRTYVLRSLRELEIGGLISKRGRTIKQIQPYTLLVDHKAEIAQNTKQEITQVAHSITCSDCRRPGRIARSGICVICIRRANTDRQVRDVLAANPHATREQVYLSLKSRRAKEINAALDRLMAVPA